MIDGFDYNSYFQSAGQHQSQQQVQQQKFCRSNLATTISGSAPTAEFIDDIDLMLNKILLHHWHLTTSSFCRGCNTRNGHFQGATTKMEQRVAQHCLQQSSTTRYGIDIVNNKFDQKIWNNKFDQKIWIQQCHLQHRDGQEEQQPP